ncbi:MAG: hypothetical protein IT166_04535 [Bryobacterales bacterium]|nr:hypothetical protein [Bryobacterales bacterium]
MLLILAFLSLAAGLYSALAYFWGNIGVEAYRNLLLGATFAWFVFATLRAQRR